MDNKANFIKDAIIMATVTKTFLDAHPVAISADPYQGKPSMQMSEYGGGLEVLSALETDNNKVEVERFHSHVSNKDMLTHTIEVSGVIFLVVTSAE